MKKQQSGKQEVLTRKEMLQVKNMISQKILAVQEKKSFDQGFGSTVDSTGTILKLTTITQGDTDSARDGDHIKLLSVEMRGQFNYADTTNALRNIIFRWNQDDTSSTPTVGDILQSSSPFSALNRDNERARKFDIIHDAFLVVANVGPGTVSDCFKKNMKSIIAFQATASTGTGHLYQMLISDSGAATHPSFNSIFRTYFTDS